MVSIIVQFIAGIILGFYVSRAITLFVIASKKAKQARVDMINVPTWAPRPREHGFTKWPFPDLDKYHPTGPAERSAIRDKRRVQKATEYAQALQDRRRAFAWPYWEITSRRAEKREANIILREVIAKQTMKALEDLKREADKRSKEEA
ncbi:MULTISPECIES: hypothetical protein [Micrococcales]|uniref:hypothetical protein n=1 Tax=Micrococcales TaxID=85006 RepID=UPI002595DCBF|nr:MULTISPECIES: hypothetical protein [Micrococcales]